MTERPIIGITMGDPAGIGPEITLRALAEASVYEACKPIVIGDAAVLEAAKKIPGMVQPVIRPVSSIGEARFAHGVIDVLDMSVIADAGQLCTGAVSAASGGAAFKYIVKCIELALAGAVDATVTNPINKEAINLAGHHFSGHTEIYAHYTGTKKYFMMLAHDDMRIVHVSTHVSLREACDRVQKKRVLEAVCMADKVCKDLGIAAPRIGVAGLNPHCGENGLFGREELDEILPAVMEAQARGINVDGPIPPDSIFSKALGGWYDIVVAMYHDQGHIPIKVMGFTYNKARQEWESVKGVNITLGLPVIRVSVDHGTAFDQAWKGTASDASLKSAISYAIGFARAGSDGSTGSGHN